MRKTILFLILLGSFTLQAQDDVKYQTPPKAIYDLVMAEPTPSVSFDSRGEWMLLMKRSSFPGIEDLAQPELRIAGLRINPRNFGPSRGGYVTGLELKNIRTGETFPVSGLPENLKAGSIRWSPDDSRIAFTQTLTDRIDLYVLDMAGKTARKVNQSPLNTVLGGSFDWVGSDRLLYKVVPGQYRPYPDAPAAPDGPIVQENLGTRAASRTYQDLIKNPHDEDLFDYMATAQLVLSDLQHEIPIGQPAIYRSVSPSPNNQFLLIYTINRPFSYLVPAYGFPHTVTVTDLNGKTLQTLASNPSSEGQPIGFDDVVSFPRNFDWRDDMPATLTYVQALDKGLGRSKSEFRDALMTLDIGQGAEARELFKTTRRLRNVAWGNDHFALVYQSMTFDRKLQIYTLDPATGAMLLIDERSSNDAYNDIGTPMTARNAFGRETLLIGKNGHLLMRSQGASPEGDMPFVADYDPKTKKSTILWRCQAPYYEYVVEVLDPQNLVFITSKESVTEPPNYYVRNLKKRMAPVAITQFQNPYAELEGVTKEKISYKRADGIDLTGNLYLPRGYDARRDGPLPVLMWAYPREYKSAADAAQVRGSKYTFTRVNYSSPIFWVTQGYAVLDNAEMPIVGEGKKEPNDNFIPQLYLNAHAAIQALAKLGVGDSNRVAVGGHSYGAFMTANLLAHTNLFKAGIARSGAYNRSLTPFGFQAEERTYWQAPEVYYNMSPFSFANQIKTPLLMIHGEMDNNSGTFPIQSERLFNAIKGHGGTVRLVFLPYESHGYAARENILHMLWEQNQWLEKYVKNAEKPAGADGKKAF